MRGFAALWRWQTAHPRAVDGLLAGVVFVAALSGPLSEGGRGHGEHIRGDGVDVLTVLLLAVASGALVARRRSPLAVWGVTVVAAVLLVAHDADPTTAVIPTLAALYTVGTRVPFRTTAAVTAVTAAVYALALTLHDGAFGDRTLTLVAFVGTAAAVGIAVRSQRSAVAAAEARARQAEVTREEEAERRVTDERLRIARELHDVVAHHISVINVQAGVARHLMQDQPDQARTALGLVREASRTVLAEMSTVLGLLRTGEDETPTQPAPGMSRVPELVLTMGQAGLRTTWRTAGEPARMGELADLTAYRVVQESLTNALKHGDGTAEMVVDHRADAVVVEVTNPVRADAPPGSPGGHGLLGMRERVAALGGTMEAGPLTGGSFRVSVTIPRGGVA